MKYIRSINEYINNDKNSIQHLNKIISTIKKVSSDIHISPINVETENGDTKFYYHYIHFEDSDKEVYLIDRLDAIVKSYNNTNIDNNNFIFYDSDYHILGVKNLYIKRIKPPRYVYHVTKTSNRDSILEKGLIATSSENSVFSGHLSYPNSIFASTNLDKLFQYRDGTDIWKIDTNQINNKWWIDMNLPSYKYYVVTFNDIDRNAIELFSLEK